MREAVVIDLVAKEKTFTCKEVADSLEIGVSTLRKWSLLLEQHGYVFPRNPQKGREYRQKDANLLLEIKELCRDQAIPLEEAARIVMSRAPKQEQPRKDLAISPAVRMPLHPVEQVERMEQKINALAERMSYQERFNENLLEKIQSQEKYIENSLKERDRRLTRVMSDILEAKMYVAAAKEQEKERKASIWHRLFKINM